MENKSFLQAIWKKTNGRCHVCATPLAFEKYGKNKSISGNWNADHVIPKAESGKWVVENLLPVCGNCNGLRWYRTGYKLQDVLRYGIIALQRVRKGDALGKQLEFLYNRRDKTNEKRRRGSKH